MKMFAPEQNEAAVDAPPADAKPAEAKPARVIEVGKDRVTVSDEEVVIESKREMSDWEVRDFNIIPIYFEEKKYFLVEKRKADGPYKMRYLLKPWRDGLAGSSKQFHTYDAENVSDRESRHRSGARTEGLRMALMPFYPFLGLFWTGTQRRLMSIGFIPRSLTGISIFTVFSLAFTQGVFAVVLINASLRSGKLMVGGMIAAMLREKTDHVHMGHLNVPIGVFDGVLLLLFIADVAIRYSHYLREDEWFGGFLQWMVPKALKSKKELAALTSRD